MFYLLELREKIKKFYQEKETIAIALFKFIVSFIIFYVVSNKLDYNPLFSNVLVIMLLSLIGAFVPSSMITFMAMIVTCLEVFSFSVVLGVVMVIVLLILYCLFIRFTPKLGIVMLAVPIAYALNIPCFIPVVLGLICTPVSIVAVGCGTVLYYLVDAIDKVHSIVGSSSDNGGQEYVYLMNQFKNNAIVIFSVIVFILITLIVYVVRTREITHSFEVAILTGCIIHLLAFLIADLTNDIEIPMNIFVLILGTIGSGILAFIVQNFRCTLDYSAVEKVQFEDDDYFYYVKAIPKMKVAEQKSDIKKISIQKPVVGKDDDMNDDFGEIKDEDFANMNNIGEEFEESSDENKGDEKKAVEEEIDNIQRDLAENLAESFSANDAFSEEHGYDVDMKGEKLDESDDKLNGEDTSVKEKEED